MLTCSCCPATHVVIFIIEFNAYSFAVASGHTATTTSAQRDGYNAVDVSQHDGDTDACTTLYKHGERWSNVPVNTVEDSAWKYCTGQYLNA